MNEPDLSDLGALVAVAHTRSFRAAAAIRGVSASSLSEAIRRLEARVGVRLAQPHDTQRHANRSRDATARTP